MIKNIEDWDKFTKDLSENILPLYQHHENTFDKYGIHGRLHISRAVLFAEFMSRFYFNEFDRDIEFTGIRYAIAFHDSGRQGNGMDIWESDSSKNCYNYLLSKGYDDNYSDYVSHFIEKTGWMDVDKQIVQDADVLEIMRPCCYHGGRDGFMPDRLKFLTSTWSKKPANVRYLEDHVKRVIDVRNNLIEDSWKFIKYTEDNKQLFNNNENNHLYTMIDILEKNRNDYSVLNQLIE
jgi:hypothetical protein